MDATNRQISTVKAPAQRCISRNLACLAVATVMLAVTGFAAPASAAAKKTPAAAQNQTIKFGLFGSIELKAGRVDSLHQWARVRTQIEQERDTYRRCDEGNSNCPEALRRWRTELSRLGGKDKLDQLRGLNRFINHAVTYQADAALFSRQDYWASPAQVIGNAGDCEDYAIAKFVSLLELGFSNKQLRIVVVRNTLRRVDHAVLTVRHGGRTYVLDNLFDEPVPHQHALHYNPVYSVNLDTRWAHIVTPQIRSAFVSQFVDRRAADESSRRELVNVAELKN